MLSFSPECRHDVWAMSGEPHRQSALRPGARIQSRSRPLPKPAIWEHVFALAFERKLSALGHDPNTSNMYSDMHRAAALHARSVADLAMSAVLETDPGGVFAESR